MNYDKDTTIIIEKALRCRRDKKALLLTCAGEKNTSLDKTSNFVITSMTYCARMRRRKICDAIVAITYIHDLYLND